MVSRLAVQDKVVGRLAVFRIKWLAGRLSRMKWLAGCLQDKVVSRLAAGAGEEGSGARPQVLCSSFLP